MTQVARVHGEGVHGELTGAISAKHMTGAAPAAVAGTAHLAAQTVPSEHPACCRPNYLFECVFAAAAQQPEAPHCSPEFCMGSRQFCCFDAHLERNYMLCKAGGCNLCVSLSLVRGNESSNYVALAAGSSQPAATLVSPPLCSLCVCLAHTAR